MSTWVYSNNEDEKEEEKESEDDWFENKEDDEEEEEEWSDEWVDNLDVLDHVENGLKIWKTVSDKHDEESHMENDIYKCEDCRATYSKRRETYTGGSEEL